MYRMMMCCAAALIFVGNCGSGLAQSAPSGSYQTSCKDVGVRDEVLYANCQDADGKWEATQLRDYRGCRNDIVNDNGALRCSDNAGSFQPGYQAGVPNGSYTQTCQDVRIDGDDLKARCSTADGSSHNTALNNYRNCRGDITNQNGNLRCMAAGYNPGYPGGYRGAYPGARVGTSYTQTCKDIRTHGDDLDARCKTANGEWHNTSLEDYRKCRGQIVNEDGNLRCVAGPTGVLVGNVPGGSYTQSCQDIRVNGDDLEARCPNRNGDFHGTKLDDYSSCRSDIINDDGHLRCSR